MANHISFEEALNRLGCDYAIPHLSTNYQEMLADPELDAVVVCTPPAFHCKIGLDVLRAEKHLMMEKPLTMAQEKPRAGLAAIRSAREDRPVEVEETESEYTVY